MPSRRGASHRPQVGRALLRALAAPREEADSSAAVVAVAVGHDRSTFAVSDGRVCEFTRVLEWGGQNLNVAIARALDLSPSEAEPIKHVLSLEGGPAPEGVSEEQLRAAREAALGQVNTFARELVSSLQFYQSQPGSLGIGEIIITGGTAHLDGFAAQLQRLIGVKVRIGDPLVRVKVPKRFQEPDQIGSLSVAIGLGIED
jgi:type IV pilus assembly protein PilM